MRILKRSVLSCLSGMVVVSGFGVLCNVFCSEFDPQTRRV